MSPLKIKRWIATWWTGRDAVHEAQMLEMIRVMPVDTFTGGEPFHHKQEFVRAILHPIWNVRVMEQPTELFAPCSVRPAQHFSFKWVKCSRVPSFPKRLQLFIYGYRFKGPYLK